MIDELATLVDDFPGSTNRMRCFTHILNLVVKSILQQFDVPKVKRNEVVDRATEELLKLAGDIEGEEWSTVCDSLHAENGGEGEGEDNNVEGWVDERALMTENDLEELDDALQPVRFLLTKVSRIIKYQRILSNHNSQPHPDRFENSHSLSRTPQPSFSPNGFACLKSLPLMSE